MIIITGEIWVKDGCMPQVLEASQKHVERSRNELGCISHNLYRDSESPDRLFFYEQWTDQNAVDVHFKLPSSQAFVEALQHLVSKPPSLHIFDAQKIN